MVQMISESKRKIAALALAGAMAIGGAAGVATTIASPAQNQSGIVMEAEAATKGYHLYSQKFLSKEGLYYQQTKKFTFPKTYTVSKTNAQKWYGLNKAITMTRKSITRADNNDGKTVTNPAVIGVRGDGGTSITFTGNRNTTSDGYATFKFEVVYTYTEGNTTYQLTKHYNQVLYSSKLYYKFSKASLTIAKNGSASVAISPQAAIASR